MQPSPTLFIYTPHEWARSCAKLIQDCIEMTIRSKGRCSVMLTGGRSADRLYTAWSLMRAFQEISGVDFYFGDERCVLPNHPESNYGMAMRSLFVHGIPAGCFVYRMEAEASDQMTAANCYAHLLPEVLDILILGVGDDGHIASLFPGSCALHEQIDQIIRVVGPKQPRERLTITPNVIARANNVFVLAPGIAKASVLAAAMDNPHDVSTLPVRLVLGATWLLDSKAGNLTQQGITKRARDCNA